MRRVRRLHVGWPGFVALLLSTLIGPMSACSRLATAPAASVSSREEVSTAPPVRDSASLPAGTLVSVRLTAAVPVVSAPGTNSFEGSVEQPIVIRGDTIIPRGTMVDGRVESAMESDLKPNRGYVRLALQSIQIGGSEIPVQTASLFVRQASLTPAASSAIRVEKGRLLTFRLTNPVTFSVQRTEAGR